MKAKTFVIVSRHSDGHLYAMLTGVKIGEEHVLEYSSKYSSKEKVVADHNKFMKSLSRDEAKDIVDWQILEVTV